MAEQKLCSIEGCLKPSTQRGWCRVHYMRWYRHGDPLMGADTRAPAGEPERFFRMVVLKFEGDECLTWPYNKAGDGYGRLRRGKSQQRVARLVCEAVHGPQPSKAHEVAHTCGKGKEACCNPRHLRWSTHADNMADRLTHGTLPRGERNGNSVITEADAITIRSLRGKLSQRAIGLMFGIGQAQVSRIQLGLNWMRLKP